MYKTKLPLGKNDFLEIELPDKWNILELYPRPYPEISNIDEELNYALNNPVNSSSLVELCKDKNKIAIVVDDISRPTPASKLLPKIINQIVESGFNLQNVIIVMALGLHREMTKEEIEEKIGKETYKKIKCINHNCRDEEHLAYLGKTKNKIPVYVNKYVAEADLIISVGTIEPHTQVGFGGGYKNILPGVAGVKTIALNHLLSCDDKKFSWVGCDPDENPMRQDIEEAGRMLKGGVFIVNTVLNHELKISKILAGHPIYAHREGIKIAKQIYEVKIPQKADIVITNSYPLDIDFRQSVKGIANTLLCAKEDGLILSITGCREGFVGGKQLKIKFPSISYTLLRIASKLSLPVIKNIGLGMKSESRFFLYFAAKAILRNRIIIYSPNVSDEIIKKIPVFTPFKNINDLINYIESLYPGKRDVIIFPLGGVTYANG